MTLYRTDPIENVDISSDVEAVRSSGIANAPHDGRQAVPSGRPNPDPIEELATIDSGNQDNRPDRPHLANQPGPKPGFGPGPKAEKLVGNPELGIDPREAVGSWVT